ncbi:EthD family reductase [Mycobacterium sp. ITM-2016-00317]|uniref:EthD family reductase n=1 Tax=Mycobacterium sp. ITM-2016-00317 TaxID=2099694 RepID=UPI000D43E1DE|nr:EthD family reductase [Mycobacterium sp. ITM-2016-00317]WNG85903.1 EthD family reductase [Mycobacterium sp. ITM-2016-00317]
MTTMFVTYAGDASTRFDRDYYVDTHLPLVRAAWEPHGLRSATAFFPAGTVEGTIALAVCEFADDAAVDAALGSPDSAAVMADVANFTDASPTRRVC